jgi:hypothetical protein
VHNHLQPIIESLRGSLRSLEKAGLYLCGVLGLERFDIGIYELVYQGKYHLENVYTCSALAYRKAKRDQEGVED